MINGHTLIESSGVAPSSVYGHNWIQIWFFSSFYDLESGRDGADMWRGSELNVMIRN